VVFLVWVLGNAGFSSVFPLPLISTHSQWEGQSLSPIPDMITSGHCKCQLVCTSENTIWAYPGAVVDQEYW
jgi:hypothetical protein